MRQIIESNLRYTIKGVAKDTMQDDIEESLRKIRVLIDSLDTNEDSYRKLSSSYFGGTWPLVQSCLRKSRIYAYTDCTKELAKLTDIYTKYTCKVIEENKELLNCSLFTVAAVHRILDMVDMLKPEIDLGLFDMITDPTSEVPKDIQVAHKIGSLCLYHRILAEVSQ